MSTGGAGRAVGLALLALLLTAGCTSVEPVDYRAADLPQVNPTRAPTALLTYLDPTGRHTPAPLQGRQRFYYQPDFVDVQTYPARRQVVFSWQLYFPSATGGPDMQLPYAVAFEFPRAGDYEVLDASAEGRGWLVRGEFAEFWAGIIQPEAFLSELTFGEVTIGPDGVSFPSTVGLAAAGRWQPEFVIRNLRSREHALRVVALLDAVLGPLERALDGEEPPATERPRPVEASTVQAGYRIPNAR